ncbi:MAG: hypothetical protein JWP87_1490 [Labilithrix sp.]|nr:hypothetical protein [Labilithrix sp.]
MTFEPYEPPAPYRDARPAVIVWFRLYAAVMALGSLSLVAFAAWSALTGASAEATAVVGVVSCGLAALYGVAAFVPFRPWGWTVGMVAIGVGLVGGGAIFAVPLLIFWVRPVVKAAFGRM